MDEKSLVKSAVAVLDATEKLITVLSEQLKIVADMYESLPKEVKEAIAKQQLENQEVRHGR